MMPEPPDPNAGFRCLSRDFAMALEEVRILRDSGTDVTARAVTIRELGAILVAACAFVDEQVRSFRAANGWHVR
jgi:hypothetical protein